MTYYEALNYIHSIYWRGSKLGLSRITELLNLMGNPQNDLKFIHVAGTNGKGSTCAMLANILTKAGYRTGLYTSPFIYRFNERMQIDGESISDDELAVLTEYVKNYAETMKDLPTEFELITAIAFEYFKRHACDIVVLEVGLGGEFDSTNVIKTPVAEVITAIDYDHMEQLGTTMQEIASAKAGIIKENSDCIFYGHNDEAQQVIENKCRETNSRLYIAQPDSSLGYKLGLLGRYQKNNADLVLKVAEVLRRKGYDISDRNITEGLATVKWPGRFEILLEKPTLIVDGGHNPHGIRGTAESLAYFYPGKKIHFILGMMADKDVKGSVEVLLPLAEDFITVVPPNPRAMKSEVLAELIEQEGGKATVSGGVAEGVKLALSRAKPDDVLCAIGSLYSYGEIKDLFMRGRFAKITAKKNGDK